MKTFLSSLLFIAFSFALNAQDSSAPNNSLSLGFVFGASAITTFEGTPPFQLQSPIYFGPTYFSGPFGINPYYNFGSNGAGVFLMYGFSPDFGSYLVWEQSLDTDFGVFGVGLTTPLYENIVRGFVELGTSYGPDSGGYFVTGVYVTFAKLLKEW